MPNPDIVELDTAQPVWDRCYMVAPLVLVGTRDEDGAFAAELFAAGALTQREADMIALSQNIVELAEGGAPEQIANTEVTLTVFDGRITHDATN